MNPLSADLSRPRRARRAIILVVCGGLVGALLTAGVGGVLNSLNPFHRVTTDRSQPPLLKAVRNLSRYHAAVGQFQVIIDLQHSRSHVPLALAGERTLFVAAGTVDAYVDFSGFSSGALTESADHRAVKIALPPSQLDKPNLDPEKTYVFDQRRGLLDRLGSVFGNSPNQQEFYVLAEQRLTDAAKASELLVRANENTRQMLTQLFGSLGRTVTFVSV